jgi:cytoskeleton protein RodZ
VSEAGVNTLTSAEGGAADPKGEGVPAAVAPTPGQRLKAQREAQKLSIDDVAEVLRFSRRQIQLIEADRYDELPGVTVVRGFVRRYAKHLRMDAEPLLAELAPVIPVTAPEVRPPQNMGAAADASLDVGGTGGRLSLGTLLASLVLLGAIGLVVYFLSYGMPGQGDQPAAPADVPAPAATVLPAPAASAPPAAEPVLPPSTPLLVEFDDKSWIEVRNAAQKVVFVGEYPKGTRQLIEGQAPFQLWIGKARAVRVTYGERSIDLKPHTREDVARLTVE